jgi:hypothetical protein
MTREEFVYRLVLNEICDDYENVDQIIAPTVAECGARCGYVIDREEVIAALAWLIDQGFARAYYLPSNVPVEGMPPRHEIDQQMKVWFWVTKKGMEFHNADDSWWPFNDGESGPG